ncbi:HDOD domain-containing protein [Pelagicoccus sp. SDUM812003]|uniref:HDOD domain-containing protein n=1 Tax=Pelagicoccus sp. SDUM812003 TaxID=3041267 RepID=UPI0028103622|nr:HDOD domain-containing protein [Pelagicoccus sp. SDUM812003]MDQ8201620.1 HDOD domain-containing protein [Pelagicoccus sp. SDUM812003]
MSNPLAKKTIAAIEAALDDDKSSAISEIIQIIQELANKAFSISISELSQLIGRDPTITERVISAANTMGFNPSGTPIHTISEAIHTVGFEKIRNLAISLMLAENAGQSLNTYEQREIAALSVCSGMLAQRLATESGTSVDTELLFVCSSLRNYGKLLMSTFIVDKYREARSLALEMQDDDAFKEVFGLTPLALGRYLLQSTNLPKSIMASLREVTPEVLERSVSSADDEIMLMAEFAVNVSSLAFDESVGPEQFNAQLSDILAKFSRTIPISLETINQAMIEVEEDLNQLNQLIGVSEEKGGATSKLKARLAGETLPQPPASSIVKRRQRPKTVAEMDSEERAEHSAESYQKASEAISSKLVPGSTVVQKEMYESVIKAIATAIDIEDCLVFMREEFDTHCFSARFGIGPLFSRIKNRPVVAPEKRDVFSICLARREDILIQNTDTGKIKSVLPEWIDNAGKVSSFIILPVSQNRKLFAIIAGFAMGKSIELQDTDLRYLRLIRGHLTTLKEMVEDRSITLM